MVTGLVTILPVLATFYVLYWLSVTAESILGGGIRFFLTEQYYRPGMGVASGLVIVFLIGLLMHDWTVQKLFGWGESLLYKIPLIKSVYGPFRDFLQFVSGSQKKEGKPQQVVMVKIGDTGMEVMGFVTRSDFTGLPRGIENEGYVAVYIPMSYQIGGHTVMVPQSSIRTVETSMEQGMRFILTAGIAANSPHPAKRGRKPAKT